jgi:predicted chitinase
MAKLTKSETRELILDECEVQGLYLDTQKAYVLATMGWETAGTWQPVREAFWKSEAWRKRHLRYWPYYGRGYVQLTWDWNYKKFSKILGLDLINHPDDVMDPEIAAFILVYGFKHGSFTGRRLEKYVNEDKTDFYHARKCINGMDRASKIADIAEKYLKKFF